MTTNLIGNAGWLLERGKYPCQVVYLSATGWMPDPVAAIRFARRCDAEAMAVNMIGTSAYYRQGITAGEHMFYDTRGPAIVKAQTNSLAEERL